MDTGQWLAVGGGILFGLVIVPIIRSVRNRRPIDLISPVLEGEHTDRLLGGGAGSRHQRTMLQKPLPRAGFLTFYDPGSSISSIFKTLGFLQSPLEALLKFDNNTQAAHAYTKPCWRQVRMAGWANLHNRTLAVQSQFAPKGETMASARVVVLATLLWYQATGEWLFQEQSIRCPDDNQCGYHAIVSVWGKIEVGSSMHDVTRDNLFPVTEITPVE